MVNGKETRKDLEPKVDLNTRGEPLPEIPEAAECRAKGGKWDAINGVCILPEKPVAPPVNPSGTEVFTNQTGRQSGITLPDGRDLLGLSPDEVAEISARELKKRQLPAGSEPVGTAQAAVEQAALGANLAGQVGDIQPSVATPTGLDFGEAAVVGFRDAIPRALAVAGGAAVAGAAAGVVTTGGIASIPLAALGAIAGFVGSISSSMIGNMKSQRSDTTTGQQRVLDEGKQTMKDWATMAKSDPANRTEYLKQYNIVSQQIQDAHVQMLTDTNADVAKFETALPNLAEFNSFYAEGGERDALDNEMQIALQTPVSPDYEMVELNSRRG